MKLRKITRGEAISALMEIKGEFIMKGKLAPSKAKESYLYAEATEMSIKALENDISKDEALLKGVIIGVALTIILIGIYTLLT